MKHKKAVYYNKNQERCFIRAEKLNSDPNTIVELKQYQLFDSTEEFELTIVDNTLNDRKSHFRLKTNEFSKRFYEGSDSEQHDNKIIELVNKLNSEKSKVSFKYNDFSAYPSVQKDLIKFSQYIFKDEVTKETETGFPYARYDIFGLDSEFCVSKNRPEVIIEVVDESFSEMNLFNYLIERTKKTSLIVIYYFLKNEKRFNDLIIDEPNNKTFRVSAFIRNGLFYYCGIPLHPKEHEITNDIDNEYRYYNFVEREIIKPIKKGQDIKIKKLK